MTVKVYIKLNPKKHSITSLIENISGVINLIRQRHPLDRDIKVYISSFKLKMHIRTILLRCGVFYELAETKQKYDYAITDSPKIAKSLRKAKTTVREIIL